MALQLIPLFDEPELILTMYVATERRLGRVPVNLHGFDLTRMNLAGVDLTNVELSGAKYNKALLEAVLDQDAREKVTGWVNAAATNIQAHYRGHRLFHEKESPEASLSILKTQDRDGNPVIHYRLPDQSRSLGFRFVQKPPEITDGPGGYAKKITHADPTADGFIIMSANEGLPPDFVASLDNREMNRFIRDHNLTTLVPLYRINQNQFLARNMGKRDLIRQLRAGEYQFQIRHFIPAARDLQTLHDHNIVHRDIKPENIIHKDGVMYLVDLDFMEYVDRIEYDRGTLRYVHVKLRRDFLSNAIKIDQHGFFLTMMCAYHRTTPSENGKFDSILIERFVNALPCARHRLELANFLVRPNENSLSQPLQAYLLPAPFRLQPSDRRWKSRQMGLQTLGA